MIATVGIASGHNTLADVLFLAAFIVFVIGAVLTAVTKPLVLTWVLAFAGLACVALAWLVL